MMISFKLDYPERCHNHFLNLIVFVAFHFKSNFIPARILKFEVVFHLEKNWSVFHWTKKIRSSFILIKVVFQILSGWVKIMLHTNTNTAPQKKQLFYVVTRFTVNIDCKITWGQWPPFPPRKLEVCTINSVTDCLGH